MKPKYIILSLLVVLLFAGGFYLYQQAFSDRQADVWSFVPENAVFVYASEDIPQLWETLEEQPVGKISQNIPVWERLKTFRQQLDSVAEGKLTPFLENRQILSSMHITGNNSFDYLFYVPLSGRKNNQVLESISQAFLNDPAYRHSVRNYHDTQIEEFVHTPSKKGFSFFVQQGYLVGSFTPFLVEDVIRQLGEEKEGKGFKQQHPKLFQMSHSDAEQGNLYVNGSRIGNFLNLFLKGSGFQNSFPYAAKLDLVINNDGLLLNGYTAAETGEKAPYLQSLLHEQPQSLDIANLVPLRTAVLTFYGFGNGEEWHRKLEAQGVVPGWQSLIKAYPEAEKLPSVFGKRVGLAEVPNHQGGNNRLLYLHTLKQKEAAEKIRKLAENMASKSEDSLFQENFSGYTITQLNFPNFPEALFGKAFSGFEECFYLQLNDYLVLGNSIQELKALLLDVERDNTWQKSLPFYQFLEKTNQEVNYGVYVNTERIWEELRTAAEPGWGTYFDQYGPYLRQFNRLALQFSSLDEVFYTNFLLQATPQQVQDLKQLRFTNLQESQLKGPAASKPMLFESSQQKKRQILVQDTLNRLYLLDEQGVIQKRDSLSAPLVGEVFQIGFRKNSPADFLAVTEKALYLYNPSLNLRKGFPVAVPHNTRLQWVNLIDYNGSKMYRILGAASSGDIFMFDMEGNNLEGWQPRKLNGALSAPPGHLRVRGKDVLYASQKKGLVHMFNRRGSSYGGFPIDLKDSLLGQFFIKPGSDFKSTEFTTVTKGGEVVTFNLLGKVTHRVQLFKPDVNSSFVLVPEKQQSGFLLARQSNNRLSLLDAKGNLLFEKDYLGAANVLIQYFHFGADKDLIAVTDPVEEFTFLYDIKGNLLNFEPLNSCCPLEIQLEEKKGDYLIYKSYQNQLTVLKGVE